ncbi:MAG: hypothetical protein IT449_13565 [Phycisphaerales bacterium]|nr:hypothetical protein [Phycisphaerales bacterium]
MLAALACSMILLAASLEALQPRLADHYRWAMAHGQSDWAGEIAIPPTGASDERWEGIEIIPVIAGGELNLADPPASHFRVSPDGDIERTLLWENQARVPNRPGRVCVEVAFNPENASWTLRQQAAVETLVSALRRRIPSLDGESPPIHVASANPAPPAGASGLPALLADVRN